MVADGSVVRVVSPARSVGSRRSFGCASCTSMCGCSPAGLVPSILGGRRKGFSSPATVWPEVAECLGSLVAVEVLLVFAVSSSVLGPFFLSDCGPAYDLRSVISGFWQFSSRGMSASARCLWFLPWLALWSVPYLAQGERFRRPTVRRPSSQDEREGFLFGVGKRWCCSPNLCCRQWIFL